MLFTHKEKERERESENEREERVQKVADGDSLFRVNRSKLKVYFSIWFFRKSDKYLFKVKNSCCENREF